MTATEAALFAAGRLSPRDHRRFLQQAATTCALCQRKLRFYLPPGETSPERHIALWTEERDGLTRLQDRQGSAPFDGSYSRFRHVARKVHGWARVEHLLELTHELRYRDPKQMLLLAQGAASVANNLGTLPIDRGRYTSSLKADLRARTQIGLANACRLNHDFAHAKACLGAAAALAEKGHCAPRTTALLKDIYASVLMDQRRLAEALRLLENLHHHYLAFGETHLAGRTLTSKGIALALDGRLREAAAAFGQSLSLLDPTQDEKLVLNARFDILQMLVLGGDIQEARRFLVESELDKGFSDDPLILLKLRWVEGKIFTATGELSRAIEILTEVRDAYHHRDRRYLVALTNLDVSNILLRQGRRAEVKPLAEEALRIFRDLRIESEALKAVCLLGAAGG